MKHDSHVLFTLYTVLKRIKLLEKWEKWNEGQKRQTIFPLYEKYSLKIYLNIIQRSPKEIDNLKNIH